MPQDGHGVCDVRAEDALYFLQACVATSLLAADKKERMFHASIYPGR